MSKWYRYVVIALSAIVVVLVCLLADTAASLSLSNDEAIRLGESLYDCQGDK